MQLEGGSMDVGGGGGVVVVLWGGIVGGILVEKLV